VKKRAYAAAVEAGKKRYYKGKDKGKCSPAEKKEDIQ
jgi:hypothetical protein